MTEADDLMMLRSIVRSNVKPKCGKNSSESLHVSYMLLFHVSPKLLYRLRTGWRSDKATYCEPANSTKSLEVGLASLYPLRD